MSKETMKRRGIIATGATAVGVTVTGGLTWLFTRGDSDGDGDGDEKGAQSTPKSDGNAAENDTPENGEAPRAGEEDVEQNASDQPEAANPEPEPEVETNESAINESVEADEPTSEDVTISNTELDTQSNTATVTGTVTNEADVALTIDLEVQFLRDGKSLGRPALGGTTGLAPGDDWSFSISTSGSGAGEATDYEIATTVQTSVR